MPSEDLAAWLELLPIKGLGPATLSRLITQLGGPEALLAATAKELTESYGISPRIVAALHSRVVDRNQLQKEKKYLSAEGIHLISILDEAYPPLLKQISSAPPVLFVQGDPKVFSQCSHWLGVVGSRKMTEYGARSCRWLVQDLAGASLGIVSGFALGIDITAHLAALEAGGVTVGVLGSGLGALYPSSHYRYVESMKKKGALVSEFPVFEEARPEYFPRRNRIISGLSQGVLVIEAAMESGALITARYALEQNRDVFAVPGPIHSPTAKGCHALIQEGAKLVHEAKDVLAEWKVAPSASSMPVGSREEVAILELIGQKSLSADQIMEQTGLPSHQVNVFLTKLQLEGRVEGLPGGRFQSA